MPEHPVAQLERERCAALVAGDLERVAALLAPGLRYVHSTGDVHDRPQLLQFLAEKVRFCAVERRAFAVQAHGDIAWCTGLLRLRGTLVAAQKEFCAVSHATQVWRRCVGDAWEMALLQSTGVDPALWEAEREFSR